MLGQNAIVANPNNYPQGYDILNPPAAPNLNALAPGAQYQQTGFPTPWDLTPGAGGFPILAGSAGQQQQSGSSTTTTFLLLGAAAIGLWFMLSPHR